MKYLTKINDLLTKSSTNLTDLQRDFITIYYKTNSFHQTKSLLNLSNEDAVFMMKDPLIQEYIYKLKIERQRQLFKGKMLSLEELGIYLSSRLIDVNLPLNDKFNNNEKLQASKLLIDIYKTLNNYTENPNLLMSQTNIKNELKIEKLEVKELKDLLTKLEEKE